MIRRATLLVFFSLFVARLWAQAPAVTDSAAAQLGRAIEADNDDQRAVRLSHMLDQTSFVHRMEENCPPLKDPAFRRGFLSTFVPQLSKIGASIASSSSGGSYRLLKEYDSGGVKHLLFRAFGRQGLNYHDFVLVRVRDSIKFADIYLYTTGEYYSHTMADLVTAMDASQNKSKESDEIAAVGKMRDFQKQQKFNEAKSVYDGLGGGLRDVKAVQIVYISVAQHLGDSVYEAALDHFQSVFPNSPNTYLLMIDLYYLEKKYKKGMEAVDKLDGIVGDPILNLYRGNFAKASGQREEAIPYYQKAYQFDPAFTMNTQTLIISYAGLGRMDDAKKVIAEYKQQKSFHPQDLTEIYTAYPSLKD